MTCMRLSLSLSLSLSLPLSRTNTLPLSLFPRGSVRRHSVKGVPQKTNQEMCLRRLWRLEEDRQRIFLEVDAVPRVVLEKLVSPTTTGSGIRLTS